MIVDMHCHVLPGVDDGPETMEESLAVLAQMSKQGVGKAITTSHFHPGRYQVPASRVLEKIAEVSGALAAQGLKMDLVPGHECYYHTDLVKALDAGNALTMAGSRFVLVEFDPDVLYSFLRNAIRDLVFNSYQPIIAHFERYACLNGSEDRLRQLHNDGALLQLNFGRLLPKDGLFRKNPWRILVKNGTVDFLGSDTHGMRFRPPQIAEAVDWINRNVSEERADLILNRNIQMLLEQTTI